MCVCVCVNLFYSEGENKIWNIISGMTLSYVQCWYCTITFSSSFTQNFRTQGRSHWITTNYLRAWCHLHFRHLTADFAKDVVISKSENIIRPKRLLALCFLWWDAFQINITHTWKISLINSVSFRTTNQHGFFSLLSGSPVWQFVDNSCQNLTMWDILEIISCHCSELTEPSCLNVWQKMFATESYS